MHRFFFFSYCKFGMFIKFMTWILEMIITWRTNRPPQVIIMGIDSGFRFPNTSRVCPRVIFHQINYPSAFACNKVYNTKSLIIWFEIICLQQSFIILVRLGWHFFLSKVFACNSFFLLLSLLPAIMSWRFLFLLKATTREFLKISLSLGSICKIDLEEFC